MDKEELKCLLKEYLRIEVNYPKELCSGMSGESWYGEDEHQIVVGVFFDGELICEDTSDIV